MKNHVRSAHAAIEREARAADGLPNPWVLAVESLRGELRRRQNERQGATEVLQSTSPETGSAGCSGCPDPVAQRAAGPVRRGPAADQATPGDGAGDAGRALRRRRSQDEEG